MRRVGMVHVWARIANRNGISMATGESAESPQVTPTGDGGNQ